MYMSTDYDYDQLCFLDFNSTCDMQLDPDNEWAKAVSRLPWQFWETLYIASFLQKVGTLAKPYRMVLGSLIGKPAIMHTFSHLSIHETTISCMIE